MDILQLREYLSILMISKSTAVTITAFHILVSKVFGSSKSEMYNKQVVCLVKIS